MTKLLVVINSDDNGKVELESGTEEIYLLEPITTTTTTTTIAPISNDFITEWNMSTGNFTLPLNPANNYDMIVDWGDGSTSTITAYDDVAATHNYTTSISDCQISINGTCGSFYVNDGSTKLLLTKVIQWGDVGFTTFNFAFRGCSNLTTLPLGSITGAASVSTYGFYGTFLGCSSLTAIPTGLFDNNTAVSTNGFYYTFYDCSSLIAIPTGLFDNNTQVSTGGFRYTFNGCSSLTAIPTGLFDNNTLVSTSGFYYTFNGCSSLTTIPTGLFDNNTLVSTFGFYGTFQDCSSLTAIPTGLFDNNTAVSTTGFAYTFNGCTSLIGSSGQLWLNPSGASNYTLTSPDYNSGIPGGDNCYNGCTGLSDYATIPAYWK